MPPRRAAIPTCWSWTTVLSCAVATSTAGRTRRASSCFFIDPGKPMQNASIESFNGRFREECLDQSWFTSLAEAQRVIEAWEPITMSTGRTRASDENAGGVRRSPAVRRPQRPPLLSLVGAHRRRPLLPSRQRCYRQLRIPLMPGPTMGAGSVLQRDPYGGHVFVFAAGAASLFHCASFRSDAGQAKQFFVLITLVDLRSAGDDFAGA